MTYKNPNLDRLSILDTPGFNSSDKEDAERTIGVINECDALFWVVDVNTGTVNRSSLKLIKEHLEKPLYVVINKVDTKAKSEVDKVEKLVRQTFNNEGLQVEGFIRFSSKAPLSNIMLPIKSIKPDTNKENYLNQLIQVVEEWTKEQQKDVEKSKRTANELTTQSNDLKGQFEKAINNLCGFAQEAASIPHFENHLFRKDGYELTQEENNRLGYLLKDRISTYSPKYLRNLYRDQMEVRSNLEKAWQEYAEEKAQWQSLNECNETLKRRTKELKKY
jgi:predicted GTPase